MADDLIQTSAETQQVQDSIPAEVRQQMDISLGVQPVAEQTVNESANTETQQSSEEIVDANEYLKTNLGYDSWEAAKSEIESLRQFKANPTREEIKYENEVSKKLAEAWQAGKTDDVFNYLNQQRQLDRLVSAEVTEETADDIIKLAMQLKYSEEGLNEREIAYKFNKQYGTPKEPVQGITEDTEDFEARVNVWKEQVEEVKMNKIIDGKVAKRELAAAKQNLVLPEVSLSVDEDYVQYKNRLEANQQAAIENVTEYKKYTPKALETKVSFNDEANKISFEFQFEPDGESFNKVIDAVCDGQTFENIFKSQDGNFDRRKFAEVIYYGLNKEKYVMEAMKQAKNATMKQTLLADNSSTGNERQLAQTQEPSELDKQMRASLAPYQRN